MCPRLSWSREECCRAFKSFFSLEDYVLLSREFFRLLRFLDSLQHSPEDTSIWSFYEYAAFERDLASSKMSNIPRVEKKSKQYTTLFARMWTRSSRGWYFSESLPLVYYRGLDTAEHQKTTIVYELTALSQAFFIHSVQRCPGNLHLICTIGSSRKTARTVSVLEDIVMHLRSYIQDYLDLNVYPIYTTPPHLHTSSTWQPN